MLQDYLINYSCFLGEVGFFVLDGFFRMERRIEKRRTEPFLSGCSASAGRKLRRLSDRLVCIRCIATPPSSVAKSKPRSTKRSPVDISVRLPVNVSLAGLLSSVVTLSARDAMDVGRDVDRFDSLVALSGAPKYASYPRSRSGCIFLFHLTISISFGI